MRDENLNTLASEFWKTLLLANGKTIKLVTKKMNKINNGNPITFTFNGTFSGEKKRYNISNNEYNTEIIGKVKILISDILETKEIINVNGAEYEYSLPKENISNFVDTVVIDNVIYKIQEERRNGFNHLLILTIVRR